MRKDKKQDSDYKNNFAKENYYRPAILLPIELKTALKHHIGKESMSGYVNRLINNDMK